MTRRDWMREALALAKQAQLAGEVPVGAVVVHEGNIVARARNERETTGDPTAHAEVLALRRAAAALGRRRLKGCTLVVTLEPCPMCATAISFARIRRVYFGAYDPKGGGIENGPRLYSQPTCHHAPEVYGGICESDAVRMLRAFFQEKRGAPENGTM